jgi:hypothetical protein
MSSWTKLYRKVNGLDTINRRAEKERQAVEAKRGFEAWCAKAVDTVMQAIADAAFKRAKDFEIETGRVIQVLYPSHPPVGADVGPSMTFMKFSLDGSEVHLYSHRAPGTNPVLHFALAGDSARPVDSSRRPQLPGPGDLVRNRVLSLSGCVIERSSDDRPQLLRISKGEKAPVTADEVVFTAFEQLVESYRAVNRSFEKRSNTRRPPRP